jgi:hypothetical protein
MKATGAACLSNQRQLAMGWTMYSDDNGDKMIGMSTSELYDWRVGPSYPPFVMPMIPPGTVGADLTKLLDEAGYRQGALVRYTPNPGVIHCPGDPRFRYGSSLAYTSYSGAGGLNGARGKTYLLFKRTQVTHPSERILWVEENDPRQPGTPAGLVGENLGPWEFRDPPPGPPSFSGETWWDSPAVYHVTSSTFNFADGHAVSRKWLEGETIRYAGSMLQNKFSNPPNYAQCARDIDFVARAYATTSNP